MKPYRHLYSNTWANELYQVRENARIEKSINFVYIEIREIYQLQRDGAKCELRQLKVGKHFLPLSQRM